MSRQEPFSLGGFQQDHYPISMPIGVYERTSAHKGKNHGQWKGVRASLQAKHTWIKSRHGRPQECEDCGTTQIPEGRSQWFEWANLSGKYLRDRSDWKHI